jgi:nodulation protein A
MDSDGTANGNHETVAWEDELAPDDHFAIAALLRDCFPATARMFTNARTWGGARPEIRFLVRSRGSVIGHAAVLRRFVRVGDEEQLVGNLGLVAVHPARRGERIGRRLMDMCAETVENLRVPYAFANVGRPYLGTGLVAGWRHLTDVRTSFITNLQPLCALRLDYPVLIRPTPAAAPWPDGNLVRIHGGEL